MVTAAALLITTLLYLILTVDHAWNNVTLPERNELVFDGRHRGYGAYQLRKDHDHRLAIAFAITIGLLALLSAVPKVISWLTPPNALASPIQPDGVIVNLLPPPSPPDLQPPTKTKIPLSSYTPQAATSLVVPVGPILIPPPDTMHTDAVTHITAPVGNAGGTGASESAQLEALSDGPDMNKGPVPAFKVDELPIFPGGDAALGPWVLDHLDFPQGLVGKDVVFVQFTVGGDGAVTDAHAISGRQAVCKQAAERTVARMPRWKPARMNGHDVPCRLTLPIKFEVQ